MKTAKHICKECVQIMVQFILITETTIDVYNFKCDKTSALSEQEEKIYKLTLEDVTGTKLA